MKRLRLKLINRILNLRRFKPEDSITIFSEARGGSTWLMETIQRSISCTVHWEPLHPKNGTVPKKMRLGWRPFIPEAVKSRSYLEAFYRILSAKDNTGWTMQYNNIWSALFGSHLLVKFVRGNLMLPYLAKKFKFKHKPIFLVRHPVAVALSQINEFHKDEEFKPFEVPDTPFNHRYIHHYDFLAKLETQLEKTVALWCLHNVDTLHHPMNDVNWTTVYYEEMVLFPESNFTKIFKGLDINADMNLRDLHKASATDYSGQYLSGESNIHKWCDRVTEDQKESIQKIFDYFNFKNYSAYSALPIYSQT